MCYGKRHCQKNEKTNNKDWEEISANDTPDKELLSKIYQEFLKFNNKKITSPIKTWANDLNRHFTKENLH